MEATLKSFDDIASDQKQEPFKNKEQEFLVNNLKRKLASVKKQHESEMNSLK